MEDTRVDRPTLETIPDSRTLDASDSLSLPLSLSCSLRLNQESSLLDTILFYFFFFLIIDATRR